MQEADECAQHAGGRVQHAQDADSVPGKLRQTLASVSNTLTSVPNTRRCRTGKRSRPVSASELATSAAT